MTTNNNIVVYSKTGCPFCSLLKLEMGKRGFQYTEFDLSDDATRAAFYAETGVNTVPQVFIHAEKSTLTQPLGVRMGGWTEVSSNWQALEMAR